MAASTVSVSVVRRRQLNGNVFLFIFIFISVNIVENNKFVASSFDNDSDNRVYQEWELCPCDLLDDCNKDCYCDSDCTLANLQVFVEPHVQHERVIERTCIPQKIVAFENSPYDCENSANGLFCIYFDNFPYTRIRWNASIIKSPLVFDYYARRYSGHNFRHEIDSFEVRNVSFYKSGDPVYIVYKNALLGMLPLPSSSGSKYCIDSNPAAFTCSQHFTCLRPIKDFAKQCVHDVMLKSSTYYEGFRVVKQKRRLFGSLYMSPETDSKQRFRRFHRMPWYKSSYVTEITLSPNSSCLDVNGWNKKCKIGGKSSTPQLIHSNNMRTCTNVVEKVTYTIQYRSIIGIENVSVQLTLKDILETQLPLVQTFESVFVALPTLEIPGNDSENIGVPVEGDIQADEFKPGGKYSGNPGYVDGKPLRVGKLLTSGDLNDPNTLVAVTLQEGEQFGLTMLTGGVGGDCASAKHREPVRFGVNMRSGCMMSINLEMLNHACNKSHWETWLALRGPDPPTHVASFGNSDPHVLGDWIEILNIDTMPSSDTVLYDADRPDICLNMISGLDIEIIYSKVGDIKNPQLQIIGARYNYLFRKQLQLTASFVKKVQNFEITASVTFTDASPSAVAVHARAKVPHIYLPEDFFYPFSDVF